MDMEIHTLWFPSVLLNFDWEINKNEVIWKKKLLLLL